MKKKHSIGRVWLFAVAFFALLIPGRALGQPTHLPGLQDSELAQGPWFRLGVSAEGLYKIGRDELAAYGFDVANLDPRHIRIHGYGGGMLPQENSTPRWEDLPEMAIQVVGESDGRFDANDYILFYSAGPDKLYYDEAAGRLRHQRNLYAREARYFITVGNAPGQRLAMADDEGLSNDPITVFDELLWHEEELNNILGSGRHWYGEPFFFDQSLTVNFNAEGLVAGSPYTLTSAAVGKTEVLSSRFHLSANGVALGSQELAPIPSGTYTKKGSVEIDGFSGTFGGNASAFAVTLRFESSGAGGAQLDYLELQAKRHLRLYGNATRFRALDAIGQDLSTFEVASIGQGAQIWQVTNEQAVKAQAFRQQGNTGVFTAEGPGLEEYLVFSGNDFPAPTALGKVASQNLHGQLGAELVIVSHADFLAQAQRLAEYRTNHDGLSVQVVTVAQVFNEFSSGRQDISAIRDYMRYLHLHGQVKYLLLMGKGSYDYLGYLNGNTNFVPLYQARNSVHPINSYSSDDYYGFLSEDEGLWQESTVGDHLLDIGVGRLPVKTAEEARLVVDKLLAYDSRGFGPWRNQFVFIADDGDNNTHQGDADRLAEHVREQTLQYHSEKLYMDAFPQTKTPDGELVEGMSRAIEDAVHRGAMVVNYTGHGGEVQWASEGILNTAMINSWTNEEQLPLFVTATCEFGKHDDPVRISGGELLVLNPHGGAIGLVTTARPVYSNTNYNLNLAFYNSLLDDPHKRLGDLLRETKNASLAGPVNRNFSLLGDPSMRLAIPENEVLLTHINGVPVAEHEGAAKALDVILFEGEVLDAAGNVDAGFNGTLTLTLHDKPGTRITYGTESRAMSYQADDNVLFNGQAAVTAGRWQVQVPIPVNIRYQESEGTISLYAADVTRETDARGVFEGLSIGGTNSAAVADGQGPEITLYMDHDRFESGGTVGSNTTLMGRLVDASGISITSAGIGQEINAVLDGETQYGLSRYFTADEGTYKQGWVRYPLRNLEPGTHELKVKVWDVHNNANDATIRFIVAGEEIVIQDVMNYPNPFTHATTFRFTHSRAGEGVEAGVMVYNLKGSLIYAESQELGAAPAQIESLTWNGRYTSGQPVQPGIYVYQVYVRSLEDGALNQRAGKLVIIN